MSFLNKIKGSAQKPGIGKAAVLAPEVGLAKGGGTGATRRVRMWLDGVGRLC